MNYEKELNDYKQFSYFLKKMGDRQRLITACFKIFITYFPSLTVNPYFRGIFRVSM